MNWTLATPEILLAVAAMMILTFGVLRRGDSTVLCTILAIGAMLLTVALIVAGKGGTAFQGLFVVDSFARFTKTLILVGAVLSTVLAVGDRNQAAIGRFEFPVLILMSTVGMMLMSSSLSFMTLYLGLELQSLALYVLCAFSRDDVRSSESGLKFFVLGALASGLLLYGISLTYGFSGTMQFTELSRLLSNPDRASPGLIVGVVFIIAGLAFKLSAVPFHMWTPDVYEGAPTPVTAFMSTAPKVAAMALLLRVLEDPFGQLVPQWRTIMEFLSVASMLLGAFAAIGQSNIKRLMAYSSIGHIGYSLIGLTVGTLDGVRGVLIYLVTYVFMSIGVFGCITSMRRKGFVIEQISDLAGLARNDPALALAMAVFMFSMAGVPPFSGFFGKLYVFLPAVQSGFWALAVIGVLTSVVGAFYYLRVIKVIYFDTAAPAFDLRPMSISFVVGVGAAVTGLFFVFPTPVVSAAQVAARVFFG